MTTLLQYFEQPHLPDHLQKVCQPFRDLAHKLAATLPHDHPEFFVTLRKLIEARDWALRAKEVGERQ